MSSGGGGALLRRCCCCRSEEEKAQLGRSRLIDRQLARDKVVLRRTVNVLLLGSGESGKSTFLKQMRIINGKEFQQDELKSFKLVIYGNIIKGMKVSGDRRKYISMGIVSGLPSLYPPMIVLNSFNLCSR